MFSNGKLRLLMAVVGFERLGMEDVPGASWVVPASLNSRDLRDTKASIDKELEKPVTEDVENDPRDLLRRKDNGGTSAEIARATGEVDFGTESEEEDQVPDSILFPANPRSKSNALNELKKKRKKKQPNAESEPLDDETLERRRHSRLENSLARQAKIKSELYIHASDDETDEEADQEFFRLEEQRRKDQSERIKQVLRHGIVEEPTDKGGRKRKSGKPSAKNADSERKRQRRSPTADSDDDVVMTGVDDQSPSSPGASPPDGNMERTPPTSAEDDLVFDDDLAFSRDRQKPSSPRSTSPRLEAPAGPGDADADEDEGAVTVPSRRRMRGGFVVDSDSE